MASSIRELIMQNLATQLSAIHTDSGYNYTVQDVQRWNIHKKQADLTKLKNGPVLQLAPDIETREFEPNPQVTCSWEIYIIANLAQRENDPTPTDQLLNQLLVDVEKAVMSDFTLGGNAQDALIKDIEFFELVDDQVIAGMNILLEVVYHHNISDPESFS